MPFVDAPLGVISHTYDHGPQSSWEASASLRDARAEAERPDHGVNQSVSLDSMRPIRWDDLTLTRPRAPYVSARALDERSTT